VGQPGDARLARTFDSVAEQYELARPTYPAQLFDDLEALCGLRGRTARVLEIGPGTGKATRGLLQRGWSVVAIEPGRQLAAVARQVLAGLGDVRICVAPFETWQSPQERFDVVFAATAWHWLDPTIAYPKAAELLRPHGRLALVSTEHVLPADGDQFFARAQTAYVAAGLGEPNDVPPRPEAVVAPEAANIAASGHFQPPETRRYLWSCRYTGDQYLHLLGTYSGHIAATDQQRATLYTELNRLIRTQPDSTVRKHYLNILHVARRRAGCH
jgi:SAM-dependent methyltransferase